MMELFIGIIFFIDDILAAWAMSAYGFFHDKYNGK